eukprot:CAMPEP_0202700786 /NCGR_PEP_ID=MMETSP1385-20130828/13948_1 /ASSEMBLY_ACC=CAM_ASM_000861 /TAXON_ID=933848 /ORGANISM="Elphidium margaritaceum" /LENGTH=375 /DNA_ID=CAMNT_0049358051 /DNA_START=68 /DNA_END=1195 /DNA_ORIENTATION=-
MTNPLPITTPSLDSFLPTVPNVDDVSDGLFDKAGQINQDIMAGTMIVCGLFVAFFGARFFKYIVFFIGFLFGAFVCYFGLPIVWSWFDAEIQDDTLMYSSLVVGALCGVLLVVVVKAAVFSVGAICGAVFSQIVWIAIANTVELPDKDWVVGVQIGLLLAFALIGGFLAYKFVEQVLKGVTAFVGAFFFASGVAFFISRLDKSDQRNVIDWVTFFGSHTNYENVEAVCDAYCIVCIFVWVILFAAGVFVQYKLHKKYKRNGEDGEEDDDDETDSDDDSAAERKKRKARDSSDDEESSRRKTVRPTHLKAVHSDYDHDARSEYAGSEYAMSVRQSHRSSQNAPSVAMSAYAYNPNAVSRAPPRQAFSEPGHEGYDL